MASITVYPNQDGYMYAKTADHFSNARDAVSADSKDTSSDTIRIGLAYINPPDPGDRYRFFRGYLYFDTSAIPSNATVTSATLSIYLTGSLTIRATGFDIIVESGQPTHPSSTLALSDFDRSEYFGSGADSISIIAGASGYKTSTFNAVGKGVWIQKGGTTKLCLMSSLDVSITLPQLYMLADFYSVEKGGGYRPKLDITYSLGPSVTTQDATVLETTSARGNGTISSIGDSSVTQHGVIWKAGADPTDIAGADGHTEEGAVGTGAFTSGMTGLSPSTYYWYRAYATNSTGTVYGDAYYFFTDGIPTVSTQAATAIAATSATGNGTILAGGGESITAHGVVYKLGADPGTPADPTTAEGNTDEGVGSAGTFTSAVSGLNVYTGYYCRAYATNLHGTGYGSLVYFQTLTIAEAPALSTNAAIGEAYALGAVYPDGYTDTDSAFVDEAKAYDGDTGTYAQGTIPAADNIRITFELDEPVVCYAIRFYITREDSNVDKFQFAIYDLDGSGYHELVDATTQGAWDSPEIPGMGTLVTKVGYGPIRTNLIFMRIYNGAGSSKWIRIHSIEFLTMRDGTWITVGGNITDDGGRSITERGVVYSKSADPVNKATADAYVSEAGSFGTGSFSLDAFSLANGTHYYARAYAINSAGTVYGDLASFNTLHKLIITTPEWDGWAANTIGSTYASIHDSTSRTFLESETYLQVGQGHSSYLTNHYYSIMRSAIIFDVSDLDTDATIHATYLGANLGVYIMDRSHTVHVCIGDDTDSDGHPNYPSNGIVSGDFDRTKYEDAGANRSGGSLTAHDLCNRYWPGHTRSYFMLDSTGLTAINPGEKARFMLRSSRDINSDAPANAIQSELRCDSKEGTRPPQLIIYYTPGTHFPQINIGDIFKDAEGLQINIGDAWKDVEKVQINIGDAWKDLTA